MWTCYGESWSHKHIPNVMGIQKQKMEEQGRRQLIIHWIQ